MLAQILLFDTTPSVTNSVIAPALLDYQYSGNLGLIADSVSSVFALEILAFRLPGFVQNTYSKIGEG